MEIVEIISTLLFIVGTTILASKLSIQPFYKRLTLYIFMIGDVMGCVLMMINELYLMFFAYLYMAIISLYGIVASKLKEAIKEKI